MRRNQTKVHIAISLAIKQGDPKDVPVHTIGGLARAYELFGNQLGFLWGELNRTLAA